MPHSEGVHGLRPIMSLPWRHHLPRRDDLRRGAQGLRASCISSTWNRLRSLIEDAERAEFAVLNFAERNQRALGKGESLPTHHGRVAATKQYRLAAGQACRIRLRDVHLEKLGKRALDRTQKRLELDAAIVEAGGALEI